MFSYEEFYKLYNARRESDYLESLNKLDRILTSLSEAREKGFREKINAYLLAQGKLLKNLSLLEKKRDEVYFRKASLKELQADQELLWGDILPGNYGKSFTNPAFCCDCFGKLLGPVMAVLAAYFRRGTADVDTHRRFMLAARLRFFFTIHYHMTHERVLAENVTVLLRKQLMNLLSEEIGLSMTEFYVPLNSGRLDRIESAKLNEPYYLYTLGVYVTDEALSLNKFMNELSEDKLTQLSRAFTKAYRDAFTRDRKDLRRKSSVGIIYPLGMERFAYAAAADFRESYRFVPYIQEIEFTHPNRQYVYDHRFDLAAVLDEDYLKAYLAEYGKWCEDNAAVLKAFAGPAVLSTFGEEPFIPQANNRALSFSSEQQALYSQLEQGRNASLRTFADEANEAFTMAAYPSPLIGDRFAELFDRMFEINTLDGTRYERVQSALINALDKGSSVSIKGKAPNETELTVALQPIANPHRQTNFYNLLADCNVPLGEVYTSPQLAGTNGLLHAESIYLDGLHFENLKLSFKEGYISDYSCTNFASEEENRRYIAENLLLPFETLPMGEFAIGTNTTAYCMAEEFGIVRLLPILIMEKTGPHFAIGDTCYAECEDIAVYNPDRKEVLARENEKTAQRRENPELAYTYLHTDITLPYDSIERITVNTERGGIDLIRSGRFVLPGTDILNEPMIRRDIRLQQNTGE